MIQCEPGGHPEGNRENYSEVIPQTANMNLNHVTEFFLNLSLVVNYNYKEVSTFTPVLFYILGIFHLEFDVCRLP